jgi:hypothetical protein
MLGEKRSMSRLPEHVDVRLKALGVHMDRFGRGQQKSARLSDRRWYFCGWYFHRGTKTHLTEGPYGPFPCRSAAATEALRLAEQNQWRPDLRMLKPSEREMIDRSDGSVFVARRQARRKKPATV